MTDFAQQMRDAFDFAKDAQEFRERLWRQLQTQVPAVQTAGSVMEELEDDDLEWVNAAGMAVRREDDDLLK